MDSPGQKGRCLTCQRADFKLIKPHRRDDPGASSTALLKAMQAPHKRLLRKVNNSGVCASWHRHPDLGEGEGGGQEWVGSPKPSHLIKVAGRSGGCEPDLETGV